MLILHDNFIMDLSSDIGTICNIYLAKTAIGHLRLNWMAQFKSIDYGVFIVKYW